MSLDPKIIAELAEHLENAQLGARPVPQVSIAYPHIDVEDGYAIQHEIRRRKVMRGARMSE